VSHDPSCSRSVRRVASAGRVVRWTTTALLTGVTLSALATTPVAAHGASTGGSLDAGVVLGVATAVGLVVGLLGVAFGSCGWLGSSPIRRRHAVDAGLVVIGIGFALPALGSKPTLAAAGVVAGGATATLAARYRTHRAACSFCGRRTDLAVGALAVHRAVEGVVLGAAAVVGGTVGVAGAALVAGHTAVEAGFLGGAYGTTGARRGVATVAGLQLALALGGVAGVVASVRISPAVETLVLAAVGAALVATGLDGVRTWSLAGPRR